MFSRVQTRNYRSLKSVDQPVAAVQALVGPNASGKTTFLDVIGLLSDLMRRRGDVRETVASRSANFDKLVWHGGGTERCFQLAVEAPIPEQVRSRMREDRQSYSVVRYEIEIGLDRSDNTIGLNSETLWLSAKDSKIDLRQNSLFPFVPADAPGLMSKQGKGRLVALKKVPSGNDNYYPEGPNSYTPSFKLGRGKSALANIPADEKSFPVSSWFRQLLEVGVQTFVLDSKTIKQPSPPGLGLSFQTDGSNLPWVIAALRRNPSRFAKWLRHVRTALSDVADIDTIERDEDRHRYLVIKYANGAEVPSWLVSDGTLRLLALTIPAYIDDLDGVFLVEEPENGIHPRAIETVLQSLSSIYMGQVLMATHSPVALNLLKPEQVLCFAKDNKGATDIISGDRHPALQHFLKGGADLGLMFAAGVLS